MRGEFVATAQRDCAIFATECYRVGFASGGITSAGFTQFTLNGPMAFTCTIVAVLLSAKCRISFGILTKLPGFIVSSFVASNFSPMPTRNVPSSTVTFSSVGCQCAGILEPSVQRRRTTNGVPSALESPATDARSHPLMIGVHFKSPKCTILWASPESFFSWLYIRAAPATANAATSAQTQVT